jgi:4-amino-4-deoxy-L-arabinose transferase-like glycosyltransferase
MERNNTAPLTGTADHLLRYPLTAVLVAGALSLAIGFAPMPFWDEDEPRFAAIARTMLETGDWVVPMYNDTLAVDKPVLMHWCMAACYRLFGVWEIPARLPATIATLAAGLALLRAGRLWFDTRTGVVAALAWIGCLLVGIEAHAATPDAILTALTAWMTVLAAEPFVGLGDATDERRLPTPLPRLGVGRAVAVGALGGLAVLCKGPVGFVGPLAVILPWVTLLAWGARRDAAASLGDQTRAAFGAIGDAIGSLRPLVMTLAMLAVAAPWYVAVGLRTGGEWPAGFFLVHNVGRFAAPMENHSGGILFHVLAMLVGFYPWSCFLPLSIVLASWRASRALTPGRERRALGLVLCWMLVWVGAFSLAATKLPNYVLPAYPAAAMIVAAAATRLVDGGRISMPGWLLTGLGWLVFGGAATAVTILVAGRYGLEGVAPAALVGLVPLVGAMACWWGARTGRFDPVMAMVITGLLYTGLAVGPAAARIAAANALPGLVDQAHRHAGGLARLSTYGQNTPNVVYYARGHVNEWRPEQADEALAELAAEEDRVLLVTADAYEVLAGRLPRDVGIVGRSRPLFKDGDFLILGRTTRSATRQAATGSVTR